MFTPETTAELAKPLAKEHVRGRNQGGRQVSYIEGWHAIAEANRIFGFDAWTRETLEVRCVADGTRTIGKDQTPGYGVSYIAKVRVTVAGVVREGFGAGHGIDRDPGLAHESAIKEAETDAMKRALMTFGNVFGLALYDKTQEHVMPAAEIAAVDRAKLERENYVERALIYLGDIKSTERLNAWWKDEGKNRQVHFADKADPDYQRLYKAVCAHGEKLTPMKDAAE